MKRISVLALVMLMLASVAVLYAQTTNATVKVPFSFTIGAKTLPAGEYRVVEQDPGLVLIESLGATKASVFAPVLTRLGNQQTSTDASLVFDKIGNAYALSEVWFPGFDGYLIEITKAKHQHEIVKSKKG